MAEVNLAPEAGGSFEIVITSASGASTVLGTIPAGRTITSYRVEVETAFDGTPDSEISVGTTGDPELLLEEVEIDSVETFGFLNPNPLRVGTDTILRVFFTANGATVGSARVTVSFTGEEGN